MIRSIILFIILISCSRLTPEQIAVRFMQERYANPVEAYRMVKSTDISSENFLTEHQEMLRVKDYKLREVIKFKVLEKKTTGKQTFVTIETTRPDILLIFKSFYQEKIEGSWTKEEIKKEIIKRLKDPTSPQERIKNTIEIEEINAQFKVRWRPKAQ